MQSFFHPPFWLRNGHIQTCLAASLPRKKQGTRLQQLTLEEGDLLELHWLDTTDPAAPCVLLLHGMEGSLDSPYIQGMLQAIKHLGWRAAVLHMRGCQGRINALPQCYHAGKTDDLALALQQIKKDYPATQTIFAIGYSLGGNQLLKFLGENPAQTFISTAAAVSIPFDLAACAHHLHQGFNQLYEQRFLRSLKNTIAQKLQRNLQMPVSATDLFNIKTLYEFDDRITAPLHGFTDAAEYYARSSCGQFLTHIRTPTLIIHAEDDPFIPQSTIPTAAEVSTNIQFCIQVHGGHAGFINFHSKLYWDYWLEQYIPQYLQNYLS